MVVWTFLARTPLVLVQLLCTNMPDGEDGTREGRDPRTGYQEKSTGEVMYNCTSIHSAGARQGSSTVCFPLPATAKVRCLQGGSKGGMLRCSHLSFIICLENPGPERWERNQSDLAGPCHHFHPACLTTHLSLSSHPTTPSIFMFTRSGLLGTGT